MNQTSTTSGSNDLLSTLNDERDSLRAFVTLLEQEQTLLLGTDTDSLLPLADIKTRESDRILALARLRRAALPSGMNTENWLKQRAPESLSAWHEVQKLADHAQRLNHTNGELIQIKMRYNQQALVVLVGATQHAAGLYGPDGHANLPTSGRTLGSG
ncbi:MAG: flagellar export chaperone FlgN [Sideroxydans sp.]|nr:flagellar export chaperone FlgN [Sideroxydans sp.]